MSCLFLAMAALAVVGGCSGVQQPAESAGTPGTVSSPTPSRAVFNRLGYSFVVPGGWFAQEGYLNWEDWSGPPHRGTPPFDTFMSPDPEGDPWILIGKRSLTSQISLDQWVEQLITSKAITYPPGECSPVEDDRATSLGGETARMLAFHCPVDGPKAVAVQVLATHGGEGWIAMCFSEEGKAGPLPAFERQCELWLSTFQFRS
jgi:hypothetical protein